MYFDAKDECMVSPEELRASIQQDYEEGIIINRTRQPTGRLAEK